MATGETAGAGGQTGTVSAWKAELDRRLAAAEQAAIKWGVKPTEEGRFISAMLGAIAAIGEVSVAAERRFEAATAESVRELKRLREQGQQSLLALEVRKETLVQRMIHETMPMFASELTKLLVIRERRWHQRERWSLVALSTTVLVAALLGGYGLRAWQTADELALLRGCLARPFVSGSRVFCEVPQVAAVQGATSLAR